MTARCCERYGEKHDVAFSVTNCPQVAEAYRKFVLDLLHLKFEEVPGLSE